MRVLLINDFKSFGGAEVMFNQIAAELESRGNRVTKFTRDDLPLGWPRMHVLREEAQAKTQKRYFANLYEEFEPEVVHVHNFTMIGLSPFLAARDMEIPTVYTAHDYNLFCPKRTLMCDGENCAGCILKNGFLPRFAGLPVARFITKQVLEKRIYAHKKRIGEALSETKVITVSDRMGEIFRGRGWENTTILNGLYDKAPRKSTGNEGVYIYHSGRIVEEKGAELLFKVSDYLPIRATNKIDLKYLDEMEGRTIKHEGYVSKRRVNYLLENCRGLISCSIWEEPFGLDVLEAMRAGKPVVATALGGHVDQIQASTRGCTQTGFLVDPEVEDLVFLATMLIEDPELARNMGEAGRKRFLDMFQIEDCVNFYWELAYP